MAKPARTKPAMNPRGEVLPVGDAAVLAVVGDSIDEQTVRKVWSLRAVLRSALGGSTLDTVPAYGSVLVRFNPAVTQLAIIMANVRAAMEASTNARITAARTIDVGVSFASEHALDLDEVAAQLNLPAKNIVTEFCQPTYHVAFLGYTAGFPYLIGLPARLNLPRLTSPRVRVPAGSIGIAAGQCGIYPRASPGGWRILGKTNASIFDPARSEPTLFRPGDAVRFRQVESLDKATATISVATQV